MNKPFLLFYTPRSGSWPIYETLLEYFKGTMEIQGLGEFLNFGYHSIWTTDEGLVCRNFKHSITAEDTLRLLASEGGRDIWNLAIDKRLAMLTASPKKYFFKIAPNQFSECHRDWLLENFQWIFLERKDLWSQLLSYLIGVNTSFWYETYGIDLQPHSIIANRSQVLRFETGYWKYMCYKLTMKPRWVLTYEDFCANTPFEFLIKAGFNGVTELSRLKLPQKQNLKPKEDAFKNLDKIRSWYQDSILNQMYLKKSSDDSHFVTGLE